MDKKYKTRDGREVIVHLIDGPNKERPVIASTRGNVKQWSTNTFLPDGAFSESGDREIDLIEVREPRKWTILRDCSGKFDYDGPRLEVGEQVRVIEILPTP